MKQGEVKKAFEMFDKDSNGTIDQKEFGELSRLLGQNLSAN
jgi:Ca2+-binding EF-hand superfamily protein